jgi:hypothetical protein
MPPKSSQTQCCIAFQRYCPNSRKQNFLTLKTNQIMKTQNNSKTANNSLTNKTNKTMKKQIAPVSEKTTKVVSEKTTKVVSQSFLIPTEDKKSYLDKKKAFVNAFKDEIGGLTSMIKFALTNTKGIEYVNCFVDFNKNHWINPNNPKDLKVGIDNLKSIMPEEIRFLTQRIDNETIVCFDKDGKPMLRQRFSISQFEKCFKLFYENLAKKNEIAKANVKQTKGAKAPAKNQISNSKRVKA